MKIPRLALSLSVATLTLAGEFVCGTGQSSLANPKSDEAEAVRQARAALGASPSKLVVVFAARKQVGPDLVAGVATSFDKATLYGHEGYSPVTAAGNFPDGEHTIANVVAVLALGSSTEVTAVSDTVEGNGLPPAASASANS